MDDGGRCFYYLLSLFYIIQVSLHERMSVLDSKRWCSYYVIRGKWAISNCGPKTIVRSQQQLYSSYNTLSSAVITRGSWLILCPRRDWWSLARDNSGDKVAFVLWTVEKLLEMWMGIQMFQTLALRMIAMKLYIKSNCPPRFSLVP